MSSTEISRTTDDKIVLSLTLEEAGRLRSVLQYGAPELTTSLSAMFADDLDADLDDLGVPVID